MPRAIAPIHSRTRKAVVPLRKAIAPKRNSPSNASPSAASSSPWSGPLMRPRIHRRRSERQALSIGAAADPPAGAEKILEETAAAAPGIGGEPEAAVARAGLALQDEGGEAREKRRLALDLMGLHAVEIAWS